MIVEKGLTGQAKDIEKWGKFIEPLAEDFKTKNTIVGFVSAKEIIKDSRLKVINRDGWIKAHDLNKLFLSKELYDFRCEQYKKYKIHPSLIYENKKLYDLWMNSKLDYDVWLFDFVMNGGLDNEYIK